jgi:AcrR family transcriptional regulator
VRRSRAVRRASAVATRARLLEAGRRAFARKGLAGANLIRDILEPADVAVGSFYHQFRNKTELLVAILEDYAAHFRARLHEVSQPAPGRSLVDIARESYALTFELAEKHEYAMRILLRERDAEEPRVLRYIEEDQQRWVESLTEDFRRLAEAALIDLDSELAAELIVLLTTGALLRYLDTPEQRRPELRERLLEGLVRFSLGGLPALADAVCLSDLASTAPPGPRTVRLRERGTKQ